MALDKQELLVEGLDRIITHLNEYIPKNSRDFVSINLFHSSRELRNYIRQELEIRLKRENFFEDFIIFSTENYLGKNCYPLDLSSFL